MADADNENDLFAIDFSDEASSEAEKQEKVPRNFQSQAEFEKVKEEYRAKVENGELYKTISLPINQPSKQASQTILHAIEELYFYRRYDEALALSNQSLEGELDPEFRKTLEGYRGRCLVKLGIENGAR